MSDALTDGRRFRLFNASGDFNPESLPIEVETFLPARLVIRALERLVAERRIPKAFPSDNGLSLSAICFRNGAPPWASGYNISNPENPPRKSSFERQSGSIRRGLLNA